MSNSRALSSLVKNCRRGLLLCGACVSFACGPNLDADRVMTPEERLLEQERLAYEAEQESAKRGDSLEQVDVDEAEVFDKKGAEMELKRASLSAVTCPEVVDGEHPKTVAEVSITFSSDGKVKDATVAPPVEGKLADCILGAYRSVIVKPFRESEFLMPWQLDISGKQAENDSDDEQ